MNTNKQAKFNKSEARPPVNRTRLVIGGALFIGGFLSPLLIPLVTQAGAGAFDLFVKGL